MLALYVPNNGNENTALQQLERLVSRAPGHNCLLPLSKKLTPATFDHSHRHCTALNIKDIFFLRYSLPFCSTSPLSFFVVLQQCYVLGLSCSCFPSSMSRLSAGEDQHHPGAVPGVGPPRPPEAQVVRWAALLQQDLSGPLQASGPRDQHGGRRFPHAHPRHRGGHLSIVPRAPGVPLRPPHPQDQAQGVPLAEQESHVLQSGGWPADLHELLFLLTSPNILSSLWL